MTRRTRSRLPNKRGHTLLLAIVVTGALGITLALIGRYLTGLVAFTTSTELEVKAAQALAAGQSWMRLHAEQIHAMKPGELTRLSVAVDRPVGEAVEIKIERTDAPPARRIRASAARSGRSASIEAVTSDH